MNEKRDWNCLRCGAPMRFLRREKLQLGKTGWLLGDLPNLFAGALEVKIFACPSCGKIEMFSEEAEQELPQRTCPKCGCEHDFDDPRCPQCGYEY